MTAFASLTKAVFCLDGARARKPSDRMLIKVIGAGAGGGLPQWNCNGRNSADARNGVPTVTPRSQASVAVSADGRKWVLLNAAPDLRQQINATPELQPDPDGAPRNSPINAVVLTNGDVDAVAGLLCLLSLIHI